MNTEKISELTNNFDSFTEEEQLEVLETIRCNYDYLGGIEEPFELKE